MDKVEFDRVVTAVIDALSNKAHINIDRPVVERIVREALLYRESLGG